MRKIEAVVIAVLLLPSIKGWFLMRECIRAAAFVKMSGYKSVWPKVAIGLAIADCNNEISLAP